MSTYSKETLKDIRQQGQMGLWYHAGQNAIVSCLEEGNTERAKELVIEQRKALEKALKRLNAIEI